MQFNWNIRQKLNSELVKNSAKLLSANILAQAIGLIVYPILTRLYAPADFGLFNLFASIGGIITLLATAEMQYAIVLPKDDKRAIGALHAGLLCTIAVVALCTTMLIFRQPIAHLFGTPELAETLWLMPLYVLFTACWNLLNYWLIRKKLFSNISCYQITQSVGNAGLKIGFGATSLTATGLLYSCVIAPFISLIISLLLCIKKGLRALFRFDIHEVKSALQTFANFPKYSLPRALINAVSGYLPVLMLTPFFGTSEIGLYGMAITLAFVPINTISKSLYQVFFQRTSEKVNRRERILPFFKAFTWRTLMLVVPCFAILYFVLPWLTSWLLGNEWRTTGEYIRIMLPWLTMSILVAPICYLSDIFGKQKIGLWFEILLMFARFMGICCGIFCDNFLYAIIGYSCGCTLVIFGQLIWYYTLVKRYERTLS